MIFWFAFNMLSAGANAAIYAAGGWPINLGAAVISALAAIMMAMCIVSERSG